MTRFDGIARSGNSSRAAARRGNHRLGSLLCVLSPSAFASALLPLWLGALVPSSGRLAAEAPPPPARFLRGDSNEDGNRDISDSIRVLAWLFLGGEPIACLDAADVNDDQRVDLSDPVALLNHLFLGGPVPPPPFTECGVDPTPDNLRCRPQPGCASGGEVTPGSMSFHLALARLEATGCGPRGCELRMPGFDPWGEPGDPRLLARTYRIILPPDVDPGSVRVSVSAARFRSLPDTDVKPVGGQFVYVEDGRVEPRPRSDGKQLVDGRDPDVYGRDAFFPPRLEGPFNVTAYHGWRILDLPLRSAQYNPARHEVRSPASLEIEVQYDTVEGLNPTTPAERLQGRKWIGELIGENGLQRWEGISTIYDIDPNGTPLRGDYDYFIVTADAIWDDRLDNGLQELIDHKERLGLRVLTARVEDIYSKYPGSDRAWKIRQEIIARENRYHFGFVLLVGNPDPNADAPLALTPDPAVVPMLQSANGLTDIYYSDLDADWDRDNNGQYTETWVGTGYPDLLVGRIAPVGGYVDDVYNEQSRRILTITAPEKLRAVFEKIVRYDTEFDKSWRHEVLPIASYMYDVDGGTAALTLQKTVDLIVSDDPSFFDYSVYQDGTPFGVADVWFDGAPNPEANGALVGSGTLAGTSTAYYTWSSKQLGMAFWRAHGSHTAAQVGDGGTLDGQLIHRSWILNPTAFSGDTLDDDHPSVVSSASCNNLSTGTGSYTKGSYAKQRSKWASLGQTLQYRGAIAFVGATNTTVGESPCPEDPRFGQSAWYQRRWLRKIARGDSFGDAYIKGKRNVQSTYAGRTDHQSELQDWLRINFLGDPSQVLMQDMAAFADDEFDLGPGNDRLDLAAEIHRGTVVQVPGIDLTVTVRGAVSKDLDCYVLRGLGSREKSVHVRVDRKRSLGDVTVDLLDSARRIIPAMSLVGPDSRSTNARLPTTSQDIYVRVSRGTHLIAYDMVVEVD